MRHPAAADRKLKMKESPVRQFFDSRFSPGLRDIQARYRGGVWPLIVSSVPASAANAGTIGTAADWLIRFLVRPEPSLELANAGASYCQMLPALTEIASMLGYSGTGTEQFVGPVHGNIAEPSLLYRPRVLGAGLADGGLQGRCHGGRTWADRAAAWRGSNALKSYLGSHWRVWPARCSGVSRTSLSHPGPLKSMTRRGMLGMWKRPPNFAVPEAGGELRSVSESPAAP